VGERSSACLQDAVKLCGHVRVRAEGALEDPKALCHETVLNIWHSLAQGCINLGGAPHTTLARLYRKGEGGQLASEGVECRGKDRLRTNQVSVIGVAEDLALWVSITHTLQGNPLSVGIEK
jgi:hypothetical protein